MSVERKDLSYTVEAEFNGDFFTFPSHGLIRLGYDTDCEFSQGNLAAHDIVEHLDGVENIGPVEDELQALAAVWYCRGQFGDQITFEGLAHDIQSNSTYCDYRIIDKAPIDLEAFANSWDCEYEEFRSLVEKAHSIHLKYEVVCPNSKENYKRFLGWLCYGFQRVEERWPDASGMNGFFHQVQNYYGGLLDEDTYAIVETTFDFENRTITDNTNDYFNSLREEQEI